ncbi:hypothetical protein FNF29_03130 [Cafeteria roenbergensis]|uniref:EF-hand domain-containing protein n=1 Tax=Cafeteria roenbergensis TaxID=33653 RepID=A0A5A8CLC4_CAFRO|nr:hypothetical protein FNF29_03130 [Cafeteria roenbergensis]|eukprot:KAA0153317.1 hypothetical protein FNF29_03130 [Cafeteria roenbergensis]
MEEIGVLTPPQLSRLRKAFLDSSGLSKAAFVAAMMQIIGPRALAPRDSNTSPELATAAALVDVFDAVDINHDGTVDWEEFSVYYLAHGSTRGPALLRLKHRLNERYGFEGSTPHTTNVTRVRYIPELQKLFVCEEGSKSLKVHEAAVMRVDDGMPLLGEVNLRGADALDVAFAPTPRLLLVACADFAIKLFDAAPLMPSVRRFKGLMASVYRKLRYMRGNAADAPGADAVATGEDELMEALAAQAAAEEARLRRRRMQAGAAVKDYLPMKLLGFAHTPTVQKTLAWHGEGEQLISSGLDEHILVWKVRLIKSSPTAKVAHIVQTGVLAGHTATVNDVLVIPQHGPPPGRAASGPNGEVPVGEVLLEADDDGLTSASTTQVGTGDAEAGNTPVTPVATTPAPDPRGNATPSFVDAAAASALSPEPAAKVGFLVSTSSDTTVRIWKYANDRISLVRVSRRHSQSVQFARFARLPRMLLTAGLDNFIQCFDMSLDDGTAVMKLVGHTSPITGLATIPSRAQAVSVDENGFVRWWNVCRDASVLDEERCLQVVRPASATVSPFLPRGLDVVHSLPTMAARTMGTSWEGLTLIRIGHALAAGGMAAGAQLTEQMDALRAAGSQVAGAGDDGTPTEAADSISTSSGSFATSGDGSPGGRPMAAATRASAAIAAAARRAALPHGSVIVAGSRLKCFETVAVTDEASVPVLVNAAPELGSIIAVLERDARVVSAGDGSLRHYFEEVGGGVVACAARAVDSRVLFVGMSSGRVHAVNLGTGARLLELPPHRRDVCAVIPCPADSLAITASWDRTLRVVDLLAASQCIPVQVADSSGAVASAPQAYQSAAEPPAAAGAGAPSPETGLQLVDESGCEASAPRSCHVAAMDMSMLRFQTSLERPLETSPSVLREVQSAMPAAITCAAVSLETALIATGDAQGNLRLWTFDTMNAAGRAVGHQAEVHAASFVPKALALVSGDSSGVVLVWDTHARLAKGTDMLRCVMAFRAAVAPGPKPTPFAPREAVGVVAEDVQGATFDTARSHMSTGPISTRAVPSDSPAAARLGVDGPEEVALPPLQQGSGDDIASLLALKTLRGKAIVVAGTESGKICVWDVSEALQRTTAFRTERLPPAQLSFEPRRSAYGTVRDDPDCDPRLWQASLPAMRLRAQWQHQLREASDIARTEVKLLCLFEAHSAGAVTCLSFQAMPDTLLSGGGRGEIRAWDLTVCDADVPRDHGSESDEVDDGDQKEPISPGAPALAKRRSVLSGDDSAKGGPWDPERGARRHDVVATMLWRGRPPGDEDPSAALSLAFLGGMPAQSASDATDMSEDWWSDEQMRRSLSKRSTVDDPLGADDDFTRSNLRRMLKQEAQDLAISQSQMLPARFVVNHSMAASPQQKAAQLAAAVRRTLNVSGTELSMAKVPGWSDRGSKHRYPAMTHEQNRRNAAARSAAAHVLMTTAPADVAEELRAASMEARREALLDADAVLDMAMAPSEFLKSHLGDEAQLKSLARPGSSVPPLSTRRAPTDEQTLARHDMRTQTRMGAVLQEEFKQSLARDAAKRRARSRQLSAALSAADPSQPIPDGLRKLGAEELASQARGAAEGPRPVDAAVVANDSRFGGRGISQRSGVNALRRALIDVTTDLAGDDDALRLGHQRRLRMRLRRIDPLEAMFAPDGPGPGPDAPSGASLATRKMFGPYKRMDIAAFRKVIQRIDQDGDRVITRQEFLADPFVTNDDTLGARMESIYRSLDRDGSGNVTVVQFARAMFPMADAPTLRDILAFCFWHPTVREEQDVMRAKYSSRTLGDLRRLFLLYDTDSGGTISRDELLEALRAIHKGNSRATRNIYEQASSMQSKAAGLAIIETQLDSIMARADTDGNDELDFEEFVGLMGPTFEPTAPIVPDIDGRYRPKLEVEISELVEDEEDPLEAALAVAKERRAEAVHEKGRGRSEADSAAGDDEWSVDL